MGDPICLACLKKRQKVDRFRGWRGGTGLGRGIEISFLISGVWLSSGINMIEL